MTYFTSKHPKDTVTATVFNLRHSEFLRILTWKKHPKIKLQRLREIRLWTFGLLVHQINPFQEVLKLEQIFQKMK